MTDQEGHGLAPFAWLSFGEKVKAAFYFVIVGPPMMALFVAYQGVVVLKLWQWYVPLWRPRFSGLFCLVADHPSAGTPALAGLRPQDQDRIDTSPLRSNCFGR